MAADELKVRSEKLRKAGLAIAGIMGGVIVGIVALTVPFVLPALRKYCLPFVPATPIQTETVLRHIQGRTGRVVDLGSGDGRVCIAAAKQGNFAVGYELNPWLVWYSRWRALVSGVRGSTEFHRRNLWKVDLGEFSTIIIFGVDTMMEPLWTKISSEVLSKQQSLRVIACRFPLHQQTATISYEMGPHSVWVAFFMKSPHTWTKYCKVLNMDEDSERLSPQVLAALGKSDELKQMLSNKHLRDLLQDIDQSDSPQKALKAAMNIPVFVEFADTCLRECGLRD